MLVRLLYEDAECILNAEMHVNPEHIVSVRMRDDNKVGYLTLDAPEHLQPIGGGQYEKSSYIIDRESYDRIVEWMERHDGELLPCPFCGGDAELDGDDKGWSVWHACDGPRGMANDYHSLDVPEFRTPRYDDRQTAVNSWNRREQ